ncbi:MAG: hypothetical protein CL912_09010 [Deltaproteobacteria bacterium]|nr:hypothetical protein [Deltaproteobacteria bacterium]
MKEWRPGSGAQVSQPHAAIVSVMAFVRLGTDEAAAAAEQQSKRKRVSDVDCSNRLWHAFHSKEL